MKNNLVKIILAVAVTMSAPVYSLVLTFEGLGDLTPVGSFYNTAPQDYDVVFSSNALALVDSDAGGSGNFGGEPSPNTALYFTTGAGITLDSLSGFSTGFSFYYSAINTGGNVNIYDGGGQTGTVLASLNLTMTPNNGAPDPTGAFSPFVPIGVLFSGTARSVGLMGTANEIIFDNITLGSNIPGRIPEPGTLVLMGGGLLLLGIFGLNRRGRLKKQRD